MKLKEKVVIITGASSGLGEALAYSVTNEGGISLLVARSKEKLEKVNTKIVKNNGKAEIFVCDIRDPKQIQTTVKKIFDTYKKVDILVNNAGIWTDESIEKSNPSVRKNALDTNTYGNIEFTYAVLPFFRKEKSGYIFNVISTAGDSMSPSSNNNLWKTYGASKWAMTGFTKSLIDELKDTKIKVTSFHPGGFNSDLYENAGRPNPHNQPWMMKTQDIADIIIFTLTRPDDVLMERIVVTKKQ